MCSKNDWTAKAALLKSEAKREAIDMKMMFHSHKKLNKTRFQKKGFALSLVLKARVSGTRKWPIEK